MTESLPNHYIHAHSHTRTSMPVKPAYHICTTVRQRKVVTERRRATPRPLGRRPLRELLIIHTGVGSFLETRRVGEGLCADKVKTPAAYNTCYCVFLMRSSLSHTVPRGLSVRVYAVRAPLTMIFLCHGARALGAELPTMGSESHRHALSYLVSIHLFISFVLQLGCAGTDGECLSRGPPRSRLIAVEVLLVSGGARGRFPPCLAWPA
ncbi:hypothetical protein EDB89DRAFT_764199 [Lactarius sanguifluus]|nr:hypothetical protein EDB89DRAFT_764199 [Lactarius sanguifluus]